MRLFVTFSAISLTIATAAVAMPTDPTPKQELFCAQVYDAFSNSQSDEKIKERYSIISAVLFVNHESESYFEALDKETKTQFATARTKGGKDNLASLKADCDKLGLND